MKQYWKHDWGLSPAAARALQIEGRGRLVLEDAPALPAFTSSGLVAAVDVGYDATTDLCFAALVLWDVALGRVTRRVSNVAPSTFPYVPGLLSFREIPPLLPLLRALRKAPDLILCDGQGLAHPRRFGLACHLGVLFNCPSMGWAKSRLIGIHSNPPEDAGAATSLMDHGEQIGWVMRSRARCRPTFVSPGHLVSLETSLHLARVLMGPYRLCESARAAHALTRETMIAAQS